MGTLQLKFVTGALATTFLACSPASAAVTITDYEFDVAVSGPIPNHHGTFSLAYDDVANTYSLAAIDFAIGGTAFTLANATASNVSTGWLLYGNISGSSVLSNADDFFLGNYAGDFFAYSTVGFNDFGRAGDIYGSGSVSISQVDAAVPELSTWALLLVGFAGIGVALRAAKRRQKLTVTYA